MALVNVWLLAAAALMPFCGASLLGHTIYYQMMTPKWLASHSSYIDSKHSVWEDELLFKACGKPPDPSILKVTLIPTALVPKGTPITVKIKIALNTVIGTKEDSDVMIGISDGYKFLGFEMRDKGNAPESPCIGLQGVSGSSISNLKYGSTDAKIKDTSFAGIFELIIKPHVKWGTCFTPHDAGFVKVMTYGYPLDVSKGLAFEMYKNNPEERVGIKFAEVQVMRET